MHERLLGLGGPGFRLRPLLDAQVALNLELRKSPSSVVACLASCFVLALERAHPIVDAPRLRIGGLRRHYRCGAEDGHHGKKPLHVGTVMLGLPRRSNSWARCGRIDGPSDQRKHHSQTAVAAGVVHKKAVSCLMRQLYGRGRFVGLDVGERRIGVAVSDPTGMLARPIGRCGRPGSTETRCTSARAEVSRLAADDPLDAIVVGFPRRLDGSPSDMTPRIERFAERLRERTGLAVILQDERLTSVEAERRLATREKNWRVREGAA